MLDDLRLQQSKRISHNLWRWLCIVLVDMKIASYQQRLYPFPFELIDDAATSITALDVLLRRWKLWTMKYIQNILHSLLISKTPKQSRLYFHLIVFVNMNRIAESAGSVDILGSNKGIISRHSFIAWPDLIALSYSFLNIHILMRLGPPYQFFSWFLVGPCLNNLS